MCSGCDVITRQPLNAVKHQTAKRILNIRSILSWDGFKHRTELPWKQPLQHPQQRGSSTRWRRAEDADAERAVARRQAEWEELCGECSDWLVVLQILQSSPFKILSVGIATNRYQGKQKLYPLSFPLCRKSSPNFPVNSCPVSDRIA